MKRVARPDRALERAPRAEGNDVSATGGRGRLHVVATPIGNLADVSFRAIDVLRSVPLVAAEDTRLTRRLFARYGLETRLVSYHARSGPGRAAELLDHLRGGADLALVTDAGTPLVSDPGAELVAAWAAEGGTIVPIPGASAVLAALVASGLLVARWSFEGFLPRGGRERRERLARIGADERGCVLYEAPSRVPATLADLAAACGDDRRAVVCRELTKLHEEIVRGSLGELARRATAGELTLRGEFAIVLGGDPDAGGGAEGGTGGEGGEAGEAGKSARQRSLEAARVEVEALVEAGVRRSDAVRRVASARGLGRRDLYAAAGRADESGPSEG